MSFPHYSSDCHGYHDLVVDFGVTPRPQIVALCGSTRYGLHSFRQTNLRKTLAGRIVLTIGCDTKSDDDLFATLPAERQAEVKSALDQLHLRKIDLADEVFVLNVGGYIGDSTRAEIDYAVKIGKPVRYLEDINPAAIEAGYLPEGER